MYKPLILRAKRIRACSFKSGSVLPHIQEGKSPCRLTEDDVIFHSPLTALVKHNS